MALRVVSHLVAEVPVLLVAALQIAHGWLPTSDDAVIAWRTWDVFGGHVPLDGQFTQITAANGHAAFDLGPLQYFLVAVPERLDPGHGVLWGSALVIAGLLAVSIEAAWRRQAAVGVAVALAGALLTATLVESTVNLAWNPSVGVYALFATLVTAAVCATGRLGWLAVSVFAASLAAQCHMSFVAPAALALATGCVLGLVVAARSGGDRGRLGRSLAAAAVVGVACWVAPAVQELTGRPGNWSVLATSLGRHGAAVGWSEGLGSIAAATHLLPSWATRPPPIGTEQGLRGFHAAVLGGSVAWGVAALVLAGLIAVVAQVRGRRGLAGLGAVASLAGLAAAWTVASVPVSQELYLDYYLYFVLWPVGMALVATYGGALCSLAAVALRRLLPAAADWHVPARSATVLLGTSAALVALAGGALVAVDVPLASSGLFLFGWQPVDAVAAAAPQALRLAEAAHRHDVTIDTTGSIYYYDNAISQGVAYLLSTDGLHADVTASADAPLGAAHLARAHDPTLLVTLAAPPKIPRTTVTWETPGPSR